MKPIAFIKFYEGRFFLTLQIHDFSTGYTLNLRCLVTGDRQKFIAANQSIVTMRIILP